MNECISVIIPTYNSAHTLRDCIDSVCAQSYSDIQIIIVDDGSTDNTADLVRKFYDANPLVKYIRIGHTGFEGAVRNEGIRNAKGTFISFLDADDYWHKDVLSELMNSLKSAKNARIAYGGLQFVGGDKNGKFVHDLRKPHSGYVFYNMLEQNFMPIHPALLYRDVIEAYGCFNESIRIGPDYEFWLRMVYHVEVIFSPKAIGYYRISTGSVFHRADRIIRNEQLLMVLYSVKRLYNVRYCIIYKRLAVVSLTLLNLRLKELNLTKCCGALSLFIMYSILYYFSKWCKLK
jgi:glycosyltransferase involved in cell wall biosynthesis